MRSRRCDAARWISPWRRLDRDRPPLRVLRLGIDALVVALPEGHALLGQPGPLPLSALAREPLMLLPRSISPAYFDAQVAACREAGFEPVAVREVSSAMAQLAFVAAGLGVALVSSGMAVLRPPAWASASWRGRWPPSASRWSGTRNAGAEAAKLAVAVAQATCFRTAPAWRVAG